MTHTLYNISNLPNIEKIKQISQSLAVLDAIIMPDWEYRYFSFNSQWDKNEMMASMRTGQGSEYFILFIDNNAIGKLFMKEKQLSDEDTINILDNIPSCFSSFKNEKAFSLNNISICFWNLNNYWTSVPNLSNIPYLNFLSGNPKLYKQWADEYYENNFDFNAISDILNYTPITATIIKQLNAELNFEDFIEDIKEIGYPLDQSLQ